MKKSEAGLKDYSTALPKLLQLGPEPPVFLCRGEGAQLGADRSMSVPVRVRVSRPTYGVPAPIWLRPGPSCPSSPFSKNSRSSSRAAAVRS